MTLAFSTALCPARVRARPKIRRSSRNASRGEKKQTATTRCQQFAFDAARTQQNKTLSDLFDGATIPFSYFTTQTLVPAPEPARPPPARATKKASSSSSSSRARKNCVVFGEDGDVECELFEDSLLVVSHKTASSSPRATTTTTTTATTKKKKKKKKKKKNGCVVFGEDGDVECELFDDSLFVSSVVPAPSPRRHNGRYHARFAPTRVDTAPAADADAFAFAASAKMPASPRWDPVASAPRARETIAPIPTSSISRSSTVRDAFTFGTEVKRRGRARVVGGDGGGDKSPLITRYVVTDSSKNNVVTSEAFATVGVTNRRSTMTTTRDSRLVGVVNELVNRCVSFRSRPQDPPRVIRASTPISHASATCSTHPLVRLSQEPPRRLGAVRRDVDGAPVLDVRR